MEPSSEDNPQIIHGLTPSEAILIHGNLFAERERPYQLVLTLIAFLVLPSYFIYIGIPGTKKAFDSRKFIPVKARIISSTIKSEVSDDKRKYVLQVNVAYTINDSTYRSKNLSAGSNKDSLTLKKEYSNFAYGKEVEVYYNKKNLLELSLKQGVYLNDIGGIIIGLAVIIIVLIIIISYIPELK